MSRSPKHQLRITDREFDRVHFAKTYFMLKLVIKSTSKYVYLSLYSFLIPPTTYIVSRYIRPITNIIGRHVGDEIRR
jgi:hypothetical protein